MMTVVKKIKVFDVLNVDRSVQNRDRSAKLVPQNRTHIYNYIYIYIYETDFGAQV